MHVAHRVEAGRLADEEARACERAAGEDRAAFGAVRQDQPLARRRRRSRHGRRRPCRRAATRSRSRPRSRVRPVPSRPRSALRASMPRPSRRRLAEQQSGARGRVGLVPVVHLDDLDVPVGARAAPPPRATRCGEQGDAERGVAGLQHRDLPARPRRSAAWCALVEPGGADQDRDARRDRRVEIALRAPSGAEKSTSTSLRSASPTASPPMSTPPASSCPAARSRDQRVPHPPVAADDADAGHCRLRLVACFMGEMDGHPQHRHPDRRRDLAPRAASRPSAAADGLWEGHRVEDVATPEAFARDPALVHQFYDARRARLGDGRAQCGAPGAGAARCGMAGRAADRHPECRRPARARRARSGCCTCTAS